ncbi:MAG: VOC family protein, partial [Chthoniobacterales bacterium]|nr:VOC family protein [Chthoniobacterales bacterium]
MFELEGLDHAALAVRDVARSARWYIDVLGFEPRHEGMWDGIPLFVGKGSSALALFPAREDAPAAGRPRGIAILHLAFRATRAGFLAAQHDLER